MIKQNIFSMHFISFDTLDMIKRRKFSKSNIKQLQNQHQHECKLFKQEHKIFVGLKEMIPTIYWEK